MGAPMGGSLSPQVLTVSSCPLRTHWIFSTIQGVGSVQYAEQDLPNMCVCPSLKGKLLMIPDPSSPPPAQEPQKHRGHHGNDTKASKQNPCTVTHDSGVGTSSFSSLILQVHVC